MTLDPPPAYRHVVTLSYFPDKAVVTSRVKDAAGNLAEGFVGLDVENRTPLGPHVTGAATGSGTGGVYRIGDTLQVVVTFDEPVRVTGVPTIGVGVGMVLRRMPTTAWEIVVRERSRSRRRTKHRPTDFV